MKIDDNHMCHGTALLQVAEHDTFTAINALKLGSTAHRNAFQINNEIALYFKHGSDKSGKFDEYNFTFSQENICDLKKIRRSNSKTFIALICVEDREICCLSCEEVMEIISDRKAAKGEKEKQYTIFVTAEKRCSLRAFATEPGTKNILSSQVFVKRNDFPARIFE